MNIDERFIRWQSVLRDQLTFLNSLLLTISTGIVGFIISLLTKPEFNITCCCQKILFTSGFVFINISIIIGIITALNRLHDFRTTIKKIKFEKLQSTQLTLEKLDDLMKLYGKITWFLFYSQLILLGIGTLSLMSAFIWIYNYKLF
jgi:hypothetical protein